MRPWLFGVYAADAKSRRSQDDALSAARAAS